MPARDGRVLPARLGRAEIAAARHHGAMDADDLYGLPLDEFVPERAALAKALRADKQREAAKDVAALRKPSVAAWAVNQLVRTQRQATKELFAAGDALRAAQEDLLAGKGDGRTLRAANERERAAVDALADKARGLLSADGRAPGEAVIERVADTLHAAALDEDAREQVRDGRLERELRHAGLGLGEDVFATAPAPRAKPAAPTKDEPKRDEPKRGQPKPGQPKLGEPKRDGPKPKPKAKAKPDAAAARAAERERQAEEREQAQRATQERKATRAAEAKARRIAERATRALEAAEEQREEAAEALREADELLAAARRDADEATAEHERAQAELDAL
jgi:hypothetical protein